MEVLEVMTQSRVDRVTIVEIQTLNTYMNKSLVYRVRGHSINGGNEDARGNTAR